MENEINLFELLLAEKIIGGGGSSQKHTDLLEGVTNINWENAQNDIEMIPSASNAYKYDIETTLVDGVSKGYAAHAGSPFVSIDEFPVKISNIDPEGASLNRQSYFSFGSSDVPPTKNDYSLKSPLDCSGITMTAQTVSDYTLNSDGSVVVNVEINNENEEIFAFKEIGWFKARGTSTTKALTVERGINLQSQFTSAPHDCMLWRRTFNPAIEIQPGGKVSIQLTFILK